MLYYSSSHLNKPCGLSMFIIVRIWHLDKSKEKESVNLVNKEMTGRWKHRRLSDVWSEGGWIVVALLCFLAPLFVLSNCRWNWQESIRHLTSHTCKYNEVPSVATIHRLQWKHHHHHLSLSPSDPAAHLAPEQRNKWSAPAERRLHWETDCG